MNHSAYRWTMGGHGSFCERVRAVAAASGHEEINRPMLPSLQPPTDWRQEAMLAVGCACAAETLQTWHRTWAEVRLGKVDTAGWIDRPSSVSCLVRVRDCILCQSLTFLRLRPIQALSFSPSSIHHRWNPLFVIKKGPLRDVGINWSTGYNLCNDSLFSSIRDDISDVLFT